MAWFIIASVLGGIATAQQPIAWKTGAAVRQQLTASVSVSWEERPLREALASLSESTQVAIFLDRRIDPDQSVTLSARNEPLEVLLRQVAGRAQATPAVFGSLVYLGPTATARKLTTLAALRRNEAAALPADVKTRLFKTQAWKWTELAEPRRLLADLAEQARVTVANPEALPHDLWPASDLPSLAWIDRLTLLLAGFDLTYEFAMGGASIRLVPIPDAVAIERTYTPKGDAASLVAQLHRILPDAEVRSEGRKVVVTGLMDDHDKVERLLSGQSVRTTTVGGEEKRYTLTVENQPAGAVCKTVATQTGRTFKFAPGVQEKLSTRVSLAVQDASLDELLTKTLKPLGLAYRLDETTLEIVPADK